VLGEFEAASVFQALGVIGIGIYAGTCALLLLRRIGGDSLAYFAGNAVAAALLLASNLGGFDLTRMLIQIAVIALAFAAMILAFLAETGAARDG
jgi:hypothetical protein